MAALSRDFVFDSLLCYLSNPLFQVPIQSFMENHCLIFDTTTEDSPEYRSVHQQYRDMVGSLLKAFQEDSRLTHDQIIKAMETFSADDELQSLFQELFEQVLAMDDFPIFVHLMIKKNIELQKQALMLITLMHHGQEPRELTHTQQAATCTPAISSQQDEEEILKAVLELSRKEYEAQKQLEQEEEEYQSVIIISKTEALRLQEESRKEQEKLKLAKKSATHAENGQPLAQKHNSQSLVKQPLPSLASSTSARKDAEDGDKSTDASPSLTRNKVAFSQEASQDLPTKTSTNVATHGPHLFQDSQKRPSGKQAAAQWLKAAEEEVKSSDAHSNAVYAAAASMAGMTEEEYKKRVQFLKEQRDKLMEMKQREREKQLLSAASIQPSRPASARAAQAAIKSEKPEVPPNSAEDDKKLAMRRTIADRLKSELMGKK